MDSQRFDLLVKRKASSTTLTVSSDWPLTGSSSHSSNCDFDTFSFTSATLEGDVDDGLAPAGVLDSDIVSKAIEDAAPAELDDETTTTWTVIHSSKPSTWLSELLKRLHLSGLSCFNSSGCHDEDIARLEERLSRGTTEASAVRVHVAQAVDVTSSYSSQPRCRNAYA